MGRSRTVLLSVLLVVTASILLSMGACGGGSSSAPPPQASKIKHVVIIFQENRTPDNLFHGLPNADIANSGVNSLGQTIPLAPESLVTNYDLNHNHGSFLSMYNNGNMDGADLISVSCQPGVVGCPPPNPQFYYVNPSEVAPYFQLAQQYTFGDRMFQTNQGPSFPAHQFIISGTSAPTATSNLFASENPMQPPNTSIAGCIAAPSATVKLIDPTGDETATQYPCFDHPTLTDLFNAKGISWKYYAPNAGSIWTGPNAIQHMCVPDASGTICTGPDWVNNVVIPQTQVLSDIANGQLSQVTWVIPDAQTSDHASSNDGSGPSWVASVVNAIGTSPFWSDTAIIIAWDDWGGWYDHVAPPVINSYEFGFRVPLIVVSPYAKPAYVSHVTHDFGSILKFIEVTYGLGSISPGMPYADVAADDLSDCFNFSQTPLSFKMITSKFDASHFPNDHRPHGDPDSD
jgi:phospholipase C